MYPIRLPRLRRLAVALFLLLLPAVASAGDYGRFGPYIGVGGSLSLDFFEGEVEDALDDVAPGIDVDVDEAWGANARVGLRLFSPLAVEVQYEWLSPYDISAHPFGSAEIEQHVVTANLKLYLPIWRVQPYLLAGAGLQYYEIDGTVGPIDIDESDSAFAARAGLGLDVYLTRHLLVNAEASALLSDETIDLGIPGADDIHGLHYLSVQAGLQYRF
jgi:opacity protein-like surface antigen